MLYLLFHLQSETKSKILHSYGPVLKLYSRLASQMRGFPSSDPEIRYWPSGLTSDLTARSLHKEPKNLFLILVPREDSYSIKRMQLSRE